MKFKNTGAEKSTITRDLNKFVDKADNIFQAVSIMAKRSAQVNEKMKDELQSKLNEFAISQDQLDEVFENQEQIAVSKFYERCPSRGGACASGYCGSSNLHRAKEGGEGLLRL